MNQGPIILIDDDRDDLDTIQEAFKALHVENEIIAFQNAIHADSFISCLIDPPFLILCDINMPELDGFELRRRSFANEQIRLKTVPFLFLSTASDRPFIKNAYELSVQGFFIKPSTFQGIKDMLSNIISYWSIARRPY